MRRIGGDILERTASVANIEAAVDEALRHRSKRNALTKNAEIFLKNRKENVEKIRQMILSGDPGSIRYRSFVKKENKKERRIDWNPSFLDNVLQHAVFRTVGRLLVSKLIPDTYSGIEKRGPSYGLERVVAYVRETVGLKLYVLKCDIRKYYPSIDNSRLKATLRRYIKNRTMLSFLDGIIDSHPGGLPIGNYISQLLANLFLDKMDHWITENLHIRMFRYCDDVILLSDSKEALWNALRLIKGKLAEMGLSVKPDVQVFPIERYGLDFMGFVVNRNGVFLRKRIERAFRKSARRFSRKPTGGTYDSLAAYHGWTKAVPRGNLLWKRVVGEPLKACHEKIRRAA